MSTRTAIISFIFGVWWTAQLALAGGSGLNVIVVVNQNSTNSLQLGNDYCLARGVPPQNVLRLTNWTGGSINWTPTQFQTNLLNPLLAMVSSRGLARQAQFVVLSMDIPYRVTDGYNENSTTAALFYGFKTNGPPVVGYGSCSLPDDTYNSYVYSELPFSQAPPNTATTNSFLAMILTDTNLAAAETTLSRAVAADDSYPTQTVYLAKTTDPARNVRFVEFDNSVFENRVVGNNAVTRIDSNSVNFTNLFGLQTGLASYTFNTNEFEPGALADTLTSLAGFILDPAGQTTALAYLEAGASGSYGAIVEPCNYTVKFPDPVDYFYQTRGFTLAEAYYQSVQNPFEGLFVGEPLTAPYARPGSADWSSLTNGASLSGTVTLSPAFAAAATNLPLAQVDLFVDGVFYQTLTNLPPSPGDVLSVVLNGTPVSYTVPTNATLATVATGLASALNLQTNQTQVLAYPVGDRVELLSQAVYVPGSNLLVSASVMPGSAAGPTTQLTPARPAFLDTVATGFQVVTLYNAPLVGDWIQAAIIKTNGTLISLAVTNTVAGTAIGTLTQDLMNLINGTAALQSADGATAGDLAYDSSSAQFFLYANTPGLPASQVLAGWTTSTNLQAVPTGPNPLADNASDLCPRNHLYVSSGTPSLAVDFACDTTQLADGWHQLTAVAYEGTSVATQTRVVRNVVVQNTSLSATLSSLAAGTNATLVQFSVTANTPNVARIELFGTGGSLAVVSNQASAVFGLPAAWFAVGWQPFYAVVTDQAGHTYQTATVWYYVMPPINLTLGERPFELRWSALSQRQYEVQLATNLTAGFQTVATITATNSSLQWPIATNGPAAYYRVKLDP